MNKSNQSLLRRRRYYCSRKPHRYWMDTRHEPGERRYYYCCYGYNILRSGHTGGVPVPYMAGVSPALYRRPTRRESSDVLSGAIEPSKIHSPPKFETLYPPTVCGFRAEQPGQNRTAGTFYAVALPEHSLPHLEEKKKKKNA